MQGVFPGAVIVQMGPESLVGRFPQTVSREVERDSQVFVLLDCGFEPLLAVSRKGMVRGMFGLGGLRLRYLRAWLMIWSARLRPGSSKLDAIRRMA